MICSPAEEDAAVIVDTKLNWSQPCMLIVNKANYIVGYIRRTVANRFREVIVSLYSGLVKIHLQVCV